MRNTENIRIHTAMESQINIAKCRHKIAKLDLQQDWLAAAFWLTSAAFIAVAYVIVYL